ncbi:hypothetical protein K458DRAFT_378687 [Lentithecium fluviatile CBS 122367]|uniref:Uncharacterized protein n=1 Tax=Lentithecium fluviatile CBS 122367 TaxID=1168545 RepID=A0A6G1IG82_9PLEO|nr:hypothetical protein K458DRAFT_378687 [Lentithecium fluviatile CBS 122367]
MPGSRGAPVSLIFDEDIRIAEEAADLTITLLSPIEDATRHVTEIKVSSSICRKTITPGTYLNSILHASADKTEIALGGDGPEEGENKEGVLVWFAHLHKLSEQRMTQLRLYEVSITGVWHAIRLWKYHEKEADVKALQLWFNKWYDTTGVRDLDIDSAKFLALPCQIFNHAVGFARVTKFLAYNHIGHVKERQPKGFKAKFMHIAPAEFIGPVNHARGGLKTTLHKNLWKKTGTILRFGTDKCNCWDATIGRYLAALVKVDAFPVDDVMPRASFHEIIDRLRQFELDWVPPCGRCRSIDWVYEVRMAIQATQSYFDGLCLDCMDRSKPKGKNLDDDYWRHNESVGGRWDTNCRIKHNQSTWYVSWLGRDDTRQKLLKGLGGYRVDADE